MIKKPYRMMYPTTIKVSKDQHHALPKAGKPTFSTNYIKSI